MAFPGEEMEVDEMKRGHMPSLFQSKHKTSYDNVETVKDVKPPLVAAASVSAASSVSPAAAVTAGPPSTENLTSDHERKQTGAPAPHHPHAIIANSLQVSAQ